MISPLFATELKNDSTTSFAKIFNDVSISGQWFLNYQQKKINNELNNLFSLRRGYITFKKSFNNILSLRFTQDITLDEEGNDSGNVEMRLKYCYLKIKIDDFAFFTDPFFEVGLVHTPYIDWVQKINPYRVQGRMFLERYNILNSADFGITYQALIGGRINEKYQRQVNSAFPGKYGSFSIGVYNGAGYHAIEQNNNKIIEGRLSLRPFPNKTPGLQISYNFIHGKANNEFPTSFQVNNFFISHENTAGVITAQVYTGKGNSSGSYSCDSTGIAYHNEGYSFFGEAKIPKTKLRLFGRYDTFLSEQETEKIFHRIISGISYYFYQRSKVVIDMDWLKTNKMSHYDNRIYEIALEIVF